jgi:choline-glycine betaine transporter
MPISGCEKESAAVVNTFHITVFNTVIYVFLLLSLCILIVCLCILIVPAGTLRLP